MGWKETLFVRTFGLLKIPVIFFISPKVVELNEKRCDIFVPLTYRTKNHLGSMYFAVLAAGADLAAGMIAMSRIRSSGVDVKLVFKDFHGNFLKRATSGVHFINEQGEEVAALVEKAIKTKERVDMPVTVKAYCHIGDKQELVADCLLTLSLKVGR